MSGPFEPYVARPPSGAGILGALAALTALAGAGVLLWQATAFEIDTTASLANPAVPAPVAGAAGTAARASLPAVEPEKLTETLQRPLFERTRRPRIADAAAVATDEAPATEIATAEPEPPPSTDGIRVVGTMRGSDGALRALIRTPGAARAGWARQGDRIGAFTVEAVDERAVRLIAGSTRVEIGLYATATAGREDRAAPETGAAN